MHKDPSIIVNINLREAKLKKKVREHLQSLGLQRSDSGALRPREIPKMAIRALHNSQRAESGYLQTKSS